MIKKIIVNFPSNIGDFILTLPALDALKSSYPQAQITAIASARIRDLVATHSDIDYYFIYHKSWSLLKKIKFAYSLRHHYDILVDFKHTLLPFIVGAKQYTPLIRFKQAGHSKDCNLRLVENLAVNTRGYQGKFVIDPARKQYWQQQITQKSIFIATASNSLYKMYPPQLLKQLTDYLQDYSLVLVGADKDKQYYSALSSYPQVMNLAGKTSFADVSYLLSNFALAIVCVDSSILHLASYLDKPIVALFGPSSHQRYGPWSQHYILLPSKSNVGGEQRLRATRKISDIKPREIAQAVKKIIHEQK